MAYAERVMPHIQHWEYSQFHGISPTSYHYSQMLFAKTLLLSLQMAEHVPALLHQTDSYVCLFYPSSSVVRDIRLFSGTQKTFKETVSWIGQGSAEAFLTHGYSDGSTPECFFLFVSPPIPSSSYGTVAFNLAKVEHLKPPFKYHP